MSATQDLIAAALTLADTHPGDIGGIYHAQKDLRKMCARAMVQSVGERGGAAGVSLDRRSARHSARGADK